MFSFFLLPKKLLQNAGMSFIKAAKQGAVDGLHGSLDALAWGKMPNLGTGAHFDFMYSGKVILSQLLSLSVDVSDHKIDGCEDL